MRELLTNEIKSVSGGLFPGHKEKPVYGESSSHGGGCNTPAGDSRSLHVCTSPEGGLRPLPYRDEMWT